MTMTKDWDRYRDTIISLYTQHSLATVRQIMVDQYGFCASLRAYRGRLDRWGIRRYMPRKRGYQDSEEGSVTNSFALQSMNSENASVAQGSLEYLPSGTIQTGGFSPLPERPKSRLFGGNTSEHAMPSGSTRNDAFGLDSAAYMSPPETTLGHHHGSIATQPRLEYALSEYGSNQK